MGVERPFELQGKLPLGRPDDPDKAPEQEVIVLMTVADYDTAERNLGQPVKTKTGDWYCWSMGLNSYWKPSGKMSPQGWPGHTPRCGRYEVAPWPLEEEDTT